MRAAQGSCPAINITQGEFAVTDRRDGVISTILGSCVATCLWDPTSGVGGMNHILVARSQVGLGSCDRAGVNAMELLINGILRLGGDRRRLLAKVFGGADMIRGLTEIGASNGAFVVEYLEREGIPCLARSLGGKSARQIRFYPAEGRVMQRTVAAAPEALAPQITEAACGNDVEFFR